MINEITKDIEDANNTENQLQNELHMQRISNCVYIDNNNDNHRRLRCYNNELKV